MDVQYESELTRQAREVLAGLATLDSLVPEISLMHAARRGDVTEIPRDAADILESYSLVLPVQRTGRGVWVGLTELGRECARLLAAKETP